MTGKPVGSTVEWQIAASRSFPLWPGCRAAYGSAMADDISDMVLAALGDLAATVSGLQVENGHVLFAIEADPARGAALEPLRARAETLAAAVPGVRKVTAVLTAMKTAEPKKKAVIENLAPSIRQIIAVASGKGGVGKSTVAVNLAVALGMLGLRVGLMDADIYGPSVPRMLGLTGKPDVIDGKLQPHRIHGIGAVSMGFMVDPEAALIWRGPMIQSALRQFLADVAWGPARHPGGRYAARHRRRRPDHGAESAPGGRGNRLDAAGHRPDRRAARHHHVQPGQGTGARHGRKHERVRLPGLRPRDAYLRRAWRQAGSGQGGLRPARRTAVDRGNDAGGRNGPARRPGRRRGSGRFPTHRADRRAGKLGLDAKV